MISNYDLIFIKITQALTTQSKREPSQQFEIKVQTFKLKP